jgi:hypothetical protein
MSSSSSSSSSTTFGTASHTNTHWPSNSSFLQQQLDKSHLTVVKHQGLEQLPQWDRWGHEGLLQEWGAAAAALPAAVEQLAAVSGSGPYKVVCFDLETTGRCG